MFKKILVNPLFWIFVLALILRIYKLGEFPYGFHADEVRVGWQASIGKLLPLYYNTFGDYRPTGIFYTVMPSIALFGKTEFAVRFPSALFGALSIIPLFYLAYQISKKRNLALTASFLLAISPWHIEVSRATSEAVIALFLTLWAIYFLTKKHLIYTLLFTLLSYFFYHSTRVLTPIFMVITGLYLKIDRKFLLYASGGAILITLLFGLNPAARGRLTQVSIFSDVDVEYELAWGKDKVNNKFVISAKRFINEYAKYFGADFLVGYDAKPYRYTTPGIGLLTYIEFALFVLGIFAIAQKKFLSLPLLLLLVSPLPAALTTEDSPNLMRALYMLPFILIISSYGLSILGKYKKIAICLLFLNFIFFGYMYFKHSFIHRPYLANADMDASSYRNIGTKELVFKLDQLKGNYEKIIVTGFPDNIRPWYEFFVGKVPDNIDLTDLKCASDDSFVEENPEKLLAVDSWQCSPESKIKDGLPIKILEKIYRPDGSDVFTFVTRAN
jgi:hypothetical protein